MNRKKINRIVITNGAFTSLVAVSLMNQLENSEKNIYNNYFLAYFKGISFENKNKHFIELGRVISIAEVFDYENFNYKKEEIDFDEVFIPLNSNVKKWVKMFKKINNKIRIIFYEEGLLSYVYPVFNKKILNEGELFFLSYASVIIKELEKFHFNIKYKIIENMFFLEVMNDYKIKNNLAINLNEYKSDCKKNLIFINQYYFDNNSKRLQNKIKNIKEIIDYYKKNDYKIIFKNHPKMKSSLYNSIFQYDDSVIKESFYPIELFLLNHSVDNLAMVSVYSTSSFVAKYIFGMEVKTDYKMIYNRLSFFSIYPTFSGLIFSFIFKDYLGKKLKFGFKIFYLYFIFLIYMLELM